MYQMNWWCVLEGGSGTSWQGKGAEGERKVDERWKGEGGPRAGRWFCIARSGGQWRRGGALGSAPGEGEGSRALRKGGRRRVSIEKYSGVS